MSSRSNELSNGHDNAPNSKSNKSHDNATSGEANKSGGNASTGDLNNQYNDAPIDEPSNDRTFSSVHQTAPVSKVIELERAYRTRYMAWAGIILLWLASLAAVLLRGDAPEWLLLSTISLVFICSGLFPLLAAYQISYARTLSTATIEQGELRVHINLLRKLPIPGVWYAISDQLHNTSTMRGQRIKLKALFMPLFHKQMSLAYRVQEMERGSYEAQTTMIAVGDWLGLTCITLQRNLPAACVVLPQFREPEEESFVARNTSSTWMKHSTQHAVLQERLLSEKHKLRTKQDTELGSDDLREEGMGMATRPYAAGDSYRRIDNRAAARGLGLHTRIAQSADTAPKLCLLLDQYDLPYQEEQQDQMFHSLVGWCLADVIRAGEQQNVSVLSDNWGFEYCGPQHNGELKYLLALTRPDVTIQMKERIPFLSPLLPSGGHIIVYSGAWKDSEGWLALAEAAWLKGSRLELQFVTTNRVMTYAMREQQKVLEAAGIQLVWRCSYAKPASVIEVEQGSEHYASST